MDLPSPSVLDRQGRITLDEIGAAGRIRNRSLAGLDQIRGAEAASSRSWNGWSCWKKSSPIPTRFRMATAPVLVPIEPLLTVQWYCNAGVLAKSGDRGGGDRP